MLCAVAWTVYGITVTQLGDLTNVIMTLDAGGTVRSHATVFDIALLAASL